MTTSKRVTQGWVVLKAKDLRRAVLDVLPTVNREPGRYEIDCVRLRVLNRTHVDVCATDDRRAVVIGVNAHGPAVHAETLIERTCAKAFCTALGKLHRDTVSLDLSTRGRLRWRLGGQSTWRVIRVPAHPDGEDRSSDLHFPDVDAMLPEGKPKCTMTIAVEELRTTAKQARLCTSKEYPVITLTLARGKVKAYSECSEACFDRDVDATYAGKGFTASYNPWFIEDGLKPLDGKGREIVVEFHGALGSYVMLIREPELTYLLAPVKVRDSGGRSSWSEEPV